eukprot:gb/GECG01002102.1/.p1 GENE.gb/GECG01002102.1/~~gb/GECG01002102.1/.p1  ORF type:complete len:453 (+),score=51.01 gb/GECG01002102.1/:1-1359(+)
MASPTIKRMFEKGSRLYQIGGAKYPSVTSVLNVLDKGGLVPWAVKQSLEVVRNEFQKHGEDAKFTKEWLEDTLSKAESRPEDIKVQSADLGTRAHAAIDQIIRGVEPTITDDIRTVVEGFQKWHANSGLKLHYAGDTTVYSKAYGYAGSLDAIATDAEGYLYVLDFKTSNWVHHSYGLQLAAYAYSYAEMANQGLLSPPTPKIEGINASRSGSKAHRYSSRRSPSRLPREDYLSAGQSGNHPSAAQRMEEDSSSLLSKRQSTSNASIFNSRNHNPFAVASSGFMGRSLHVSACLASRRHNSSGENEAFYPISAPETSSVTVPEPVKELKQRLQAGIDQRQMTDSSFKLHYDPRLIRPMVVRIDKTTGVVEVRRTSDNETAFSAFKACLYLWKVFDSVGTFSGTNNYPTSPLHLGFELPDAAQDEFLPIVQRFHENATPPTDAYATPDNDFER